MQTQQIDAAKTAVTSSNTLTQVATLVSNTSTVPAGERLTQMQQHMILSDRALFLAHMVTAHMAGGAGQEHPDSYRGAGPGAPY